MKGVLITLTIFLIFSMVFPHIAEMASEKGELVAERIGAQRVYYLWHSIAAGVSESLNVSMKKLNDTVIINDSLPLLESANTQKFLDDYGRFIEQEFSEVNYVARFEDGNGNKIDLDAIERKLTIKPMQITYAWATKDKHRATLRVHEKNFSYIQEINLTIFTPLPFEKIDEIKWDPMKECKSNTKRCLTFRLNVTNGTATWTSPRIEFDADSTSEVKKLNFVPGGADQSIRLHIGPLDDLIRIEPKNVNITTSLSMRLNTSDFFLNYPAKLNVSTLFAKKVEWLG